MSSAAAHPVAEPLPDVAVRVAEPTDVPAIVDLYRRVSTASFTERFLSTRSERTLPLLAAFDSTRGDVVVLAALTDDPDALVGEGRYVPTGDGEAEFALVVLDAWQGLGIGGRILTELLRLAAARGLPRLGAVVEGGNARLLRLVDHHGWTFAEALNDDAGLIQVATDGGMPGWPDDGRRRVLVESPAWRDTADVAELRASGVAVRRCLGPRGTDEVCPLVADGACRLAEGADEIVHLLPATSTEFVVVRAEHERRWPHRLRR